MRRLRLGRLLRSLYLLHFSQPAADRALWKAVKSRPIRSIVELGMGLGGRTERLLEIAAWRMNGEPIRYAGNDLFECRLAGQPKLALKQAYHDLRATGHTIRLLPGDPYSALARSANALTGTDLVLIAAGQDAASLERAWRYVPRMLHDQSLVFQQSAIGDQGQFAWRLVASEEIKRLAASAGKLHRRAAA
jgi:hypothetical protein